MKEEEEGRTLGHLNLKGSWESAGGGRGKRTTPNTTFRGPLAMLQAMFPLLDVTPMAMNMA